jgi:hypothetical protein
MGSFLKKITEIDVEENQENMGEKDEKEAI